jgi:hypothetical protein
MGTLPNKLPSDNIIRSVTNSPPSEKDIVVPNTPQNQAGYFKYFKDAIKGVFNKAINALPSKDKESLNNINTTSNTNNISENITNNILETKIKNTQDVVNAAQNTEKNTQAVLDITIINDNKDTIGDQIEKLTNDQVLNFELSFLIKKQQLTNEEIEKLRGIAKTQNDENLTKLINETIEKSKNTPNPSTTTTPNVLHENDINMTTTNAKPTTTTKKGKRTLEPEEPEEQDNNQKEERKIKKGKEDNNMITQGGKRHKRITRRVKKQKRRQTKKRLF